MNDAAWISLPQLTQLLEQHSLDRQTGSFIGITEIGESLLISMQEGIVVGLSVKATAGAAALPAMKKAGRYKIKFKDQLVARADTDLPMTSEILQVLEDSNSDGETLAA